MDQTEIDEIKKSWQKLVAPYQHADYQRSLRQLANSLLPYLGLWVLMVLSLRISYLLTLLLVIPAAGFLMRIFIIFHDCGHNSFFKSKETNRRVGFWLGILVFTASEQWFHSHAVHHATAGNLDKRGVGDVMTLTVAEYQQLSPWKKFTYRIFRQPIFMLGVGPLLSFLIAPRFASPGSNKTERLSVIYTNLVLLAIFVIMSLTIGWQAYLMIQLPVMWLAGAAGIWMFYVQHQFENTYWAHSSQWDYTLSAFQGASYYKLPRILQWFTGNIGFHHIHHLSPRIPNYFLEKCFRDNPPLHQAPTLTLRTALKSFGLRLWDERAQKMVGFQ
jgi:acyl-lipid omega-6 desaturase (Delta-12 desaturase)